MCHQGGCLSRPSSFASALWLLAEIKMDVSCWQPSAFGSVLAYMPKLIGLDADSRTVQIAQVAALYLPQLQDLLLEGLLHVDDSAASNIVQVRGR